MINAKITEAVNKQIQAEMYSANLYLQMAGYFQSIGLEGFAHWMYVQYQEEMFHAIKFWNYLFSRGSQAEMRVLDMPPKDYKSPLDVFEKVLKHEQHVTSLIHSLYELGVQEKDYAFQTFMQWYIDEQVEEEESAQAMIDKLKLAGEAGLFQLDKDVSVRTFAPTNPLWGQI